MEGIWIFLSRFHSGDISRYLFSVPNLIQEDVWPHVEKNNGASERHGREHRFILLERKPRREPDAQSVLPRVLRQYSLYVRFAAGPAFTDATLNKPHDIS